MGGFTLTRLAKAIAETKYTIDAVVARAHQELETFEGDAQRTPESVAASGMFMHCFGMVDRIDAEDWAEDMEFVIVGHEGVAYIDTVSFRNELMDTGPFKGKIVCFPVPDSFSD